VVRRVWSFRLLSRHFLDFCCSSIFSRPFVLLLPVYHPGCRQDNLPMKFSAFNLDFSSPSPDPLGSSRPVQTDIKDGYPLKSGYFTSVISCSMKTVANRYRHAAYHNKHWWQAFWIYQHRWPWTTLNPKNIDCKRFFGDFFAAKEWIATKRMEIDYDYLWTGTAIGFRVFRELCSNFLLKIYK